MAEGQVRPKLQSKQDAIAHLAIGWARLRAVHGPGRLADLLEIDPKTLRRATECESMPELHTALNSLLIDPTALDELFALYGFHPPRRIDQGEASDLRTISNLSRLIAAYCEALEDGRRDHRETLELADLIRPLMDSLTAILREAHRIRGVTPC